MDRLVNLAMLCFTTVGVKHPRFCVALLRVAATSCGGSVGRGQSARRPGESGVYGLVCPSVGLGSMALGKVAIEPVVVCGSLDALAFKNPYHLVHQRLVERIRDRPGRPANALEVEVLGTRDRCEPTSGARMANQLYLGACVVGVAELTLPQQLFRV